MKQQFNKDLLKLLNQDREPFTVYSMPINQAHKVTIDDEFRDVSQFADLVDVLDNAQDGDVVQIKLSTVGGALHAIIPLINAMKNTSAFIHTHVESDTASAGTMIMALSHNLYVNEYATIMYHNVQYGAFGHGGNVEAQVKHTTAGSKKLIRDIYHNLLTDDEVKRLEDGLELYMTAEECMDRFAKRAELEQAEYEEQEAQLAAVEQAIANMEAAPKKTRKNLKKAADAHNTQEA